MSGHSQVAGRIVKRATRRAIAEWSRIAPGADQEIFELRPFQLQLEFTNLCNANCVFCPYELQTRPHRQMSETIFRKALADYVAMGGGSVDLTPVVGDPLIQPNFIDWVRALRTTPEIDRITVTTNGILLARHGIEKILDSGLSRINISLPGFDEAMYRRVYRSPAYKKVRENIAKLLEANASRREPVTIFLSMRPDRSKQEVLAQPDLQPLLKFRPNLSFVGTFSRSGGQINELLPGMELHAVSTRPKRSPCRQTYMGLLVQSSGDVQVCACESSVNAPALVVGNVERETLLEIWRGERLKAVRDSFRSGNLNPNCSKCDYYFEPAEFRSPGMRKMAKATRRRLNGEIVRHLEPVTDEWQME